MSRTRSIVGLALLLVIMLAGCTAAPNDAVNTVAPATGQVAGFLLGLWHGFIMVIAFVVSLFSPTIGIYEVHNTGNTYNLGFVLGAFVFLTGLGGSSSLRRRR